MNTDAEQIEKLKALIQRIRPDKIHLNTAVRPAAEDGIKPVSIERLSQIAEQLGDACEVVADRPVGPDDRRVDRAAADVVSMLKRRPCSVQDLCAGLGMTRGEAVKHVTVLESMGVLTSERRGKTTYFYLCRQPR
jgi:wyosine [tRNA(Phe)-imidazoG37] synthetase (radical SAM superfamily)